jgi:hypothetical protein
MEKSYTTEADFNLFYAAMSYNIKLNNEINVSHSESFNQFLEALNSVEDEDVSNILRHIFKYNNSKSIQDILNKYTSVDEAIADYLYNPETKDFDTLKTYVKSLKEHIQNQFVDGMNNLNGNFTDFYMLSNGGLVGDDFPATNGRDSMQALLEPGEFVLRKQAVEQMGLDNAIKLNSTGNMGGDVEVEVNIINNGSPLETKTETQTRRENNKIIVDVVLEDIRTNGPISRNMRSIRG